MDIISGLYKTEDGKILRIYQSSWIGRFYSQVKVDGKSHGPARLVKPESVLKRVRTGKLIVIELDPKQQEETSKLRLSQIAAGGNLYLFNDGSKLCREESFVTPNGNVWNCWVYRNPAGAVISYDFNFNDLVERNGLESAVYPPKNGNKGVWE